jgi:hypothetical protein
MLDALCAQSAAAFSAPVAYDDPIDLGGGGGRWFTGSAADGFGCDVCHAGGPAAEIWVSGLPLDGYVPGSAYELTIAWPPEVQDLALIAEVTDEAAQTAGTLDLPRFDTLQPDELCSPEEGGFPAYGMHDTLDGRRTVSIIDCGARRMRFRWTAPAVDVGTVWLNAGFVWSDDSADPTGDGVTMVSRAIDAGRSAVAARELVQGCATGGPAGAPRSLAVGWVVMACGLLLGARARRKGRRCLDA